MKSLFLKPLISYVIGIFFIIVITGVLLIQVVDDYIFLITILIVEFIVITILLLYFFEQYIKPIQVATETLSKLVKGQYKSRYQHRSIGISARLGNEINKLAENLNTLSIQEQKQTKQFTTVIDNTESGLVLIDEKGYIHLVNRKFISMFGKTSQDYTGYLYYDVLDYEEIYEVVQQTLLYEETIKKLFSFETDSYLEIVGAPIFNEKGLLNGAVLVLYDITELKKLESMRKDFVANVSHELKTPITSIMGFAETLIEGAMNNKEIREEFIGIIHKESKRLQLLVEDLLVLSKLEHDESQLLVSKVSLKTLLIDVIRVIRQIAMEKGITLTTNIDENLTITADSDKIKQVLINILANAVEYTPENGEVTLQIEKIDEQICFQIKDSGIGIEQKVIPRIFERFYRVDKARGRNTGGTGLGLAISKHIVEAHGGKILVESKLNVGTTFFIYIPIENISSQ